jgi:large repetitive protein
MNRLFGSLVVLALASAVIVKGQEPGGVRWTVPIGESVNSSPAIGVDGTVYIVGNSSAEGHRLFAVGPDGSVKWRTPIISEVETAIAIGSDGTLYLGTSSSHFLAINPDGTEKWDFPTGDRVASSPAVGADGAVYFGSHDRKVYALNPNGTSRWEFETAGPVLSSPAVAADGTVYIGSNDKKLYALTPNGTKKWEFATAQPIPQSPALGSDGWIYLAAGDGNIYALNADGSCAWTNHTGFAQTSPVIGPDSRLYLGRWRAAAAFGTDGSTNWVFDMGERVNASPAVAADGTVYFTASEDASQTGSLVALGSDGTKAWDFKPGGRFGLGSPVIGTDGTVYVGSDSRSGAYLHALWGSAGPANTSWPMFRRNADRTGALPPGGTPLITTLSGDRSVAPGSNVVFQVTAIGATPMSYRWQRNGQDLADACNTFGSQEAVLVIDEAMLADAGDYSVIISNSSGVITSQVARLSVQIGFVEAGTLLWDVALPGIAASAPSLNSNGTAYVLALTPEDWLLCACRTNGTIEWSLALGAQTLAPPSIAADGTLYLGTGWPSNRCLAVTPDGGIRWTFEPGSSVVTTPAIGQDGTAYFTANNGRLFALRPDGSKAWEFDTGGQGDISSPAIGPDGTIYVGSGHGDEVLGYTVGVFQALRPDGSVKWRFSDRGPFTAQPAVGPNGNVYFGSLDNEGALYAFNAEGTNLWKRLTKAAIRTGPIISPEGTVIVANLNQRLFSLRSDGSTNWLGGLPSSGFSTPALGSDGTLHFGMMNNELITITASGKRGWTFAGGSDLSAPALDENGRLYFGDGSRLVCIQASAPAPNAGWPMLGHEPRRTANAASALPTSPPNLKEPEIKDGDFSCGLTDPLSQCLLVEQSTDLDNWIPVSTNRAPAVFEQALDPNGPRFFRVRPFKTQ